MKITRIITATLLVSALLLSSCAEDNIGVSSIPNIPEGSIPEDLSSADLTGMDFSFSDRDLAGSYENTESVSGNNIKITEEGTYMLSGEIAAVSVNAPDDAKVQIVLDNAKIGSTNGPAIYIGSADKVFITLKEGTENTISDASGYTYSADADADGAIFSRADLTINGKGKLTVNAKNKHGIVSKDDLVIASANITVSAQNVALSGKDCIKISDATLDLTAGSDGMRSDNTEDDDRGYIYIESGKIVITSGNDGIQTETAVKITTAEMNITSGGGSSGSLSSSNESYKGIKATSDIIINGGKYNINSKDDCIHSNNTICITDGEFSLSSGDDGIHADTDLSVSGGDINISKSYEGLESSRVFISGGNINVTASDDGINAAGGNDGSSTGGRPGMGGFSNGVGEIIISGGTVSLQANGDCVDSNSTLSVTGGSLYVASAISGDTSMIDFDSSGAITGGTFIGTGTTGGMFQNFSSATQGVILVSTGSQSAGTVITVKDSNGNVIHSYTTLRQYSAVLLSHPSIVQDGSYTVTAGSYSTTVTMSSLFYGASAGGGMGGGMGGPGGTRPGRPGGRW